MNSFMVTVTVTRRPAIEALKDRAREQPTLTLVEAVTLIGTVGPETTNEAKMARAAMLDVIEEREGAQFVDDLTDAIG
jgi:hypothetical protein